MNFRDEYLNQEEIRPNPSYQLARFNQAGSFNPTVVGQDDAPAQINPNASRDLGMMAGQDTNLPQQSNELAQLTGLINFGTQLKQAEADKQAEEDARNEMLNAQDELVQRDIETAQRQGEIRSQFIGSTDEPANVSTEFGPAYADKSGNLWATKETDLKRLNPPDPFVGTSDKPANISTEFGPAYADENGNLFRTKETRGVAKNILDEDFVITQTFGQRSSADKYSGGVNYGVDFATKRGTPVNVPKGNWKVVEAYRKAMAEGPNNRDGGANRGYGNSVLLENQDTGEKLRFSHLRRGGVFVEPGQTVQGGVKLGEVGATGNTAGRTGVHLDLEYYKPNGQISNVLTSPYRRYLLGS